MRNRDFFSFHRTTSMMHFNGFIQRLQNVDRIKQLNNDKHGCYMFGLFDGFEKRGLIRMPVDRIEFRQSMIEGLKSKFPEMIINVRKIGE